MITAFVICSGFDRRFLLHHILSCSLFLQHLFLSLHILQFTTHVFAACFVVCRAFAPAGHHTTERKKPDCFALFLSLLTQNNGKSKSSALSAYARQGTEEKRESASFV